MSIERTAVLLRPSLRFISKLPTIKIKVESVSNHMVTWKVELDKPVNIIMDFPILKSLMNLTTFYVGAMTLESFSEENGWQYDMKISIKKDMKACDFMISPRDEEWYLDHKWWKWA